MLYQKKRRKLNLAGDKDKKNQDSTQNSDNILSNEKQSQLSKSKKKSFTKIFIKRVSQKDISQKQSSLQKIHKKNIQSKDETQAIHAQTANNYFDMGKNTHELITSQRQIDKQKFTSLSNTNSTCSLQLNIYDPNGLNANRKKFKLYCQVKKKKVNDKKSQLDKQTDRVIASSTVSESWIKNSVYSKNSQQNKSNSTQKSHKQTSVKRKINLTEKIKQIKSKQKHQISQEKEKQQKSTPKTLSFQLKDKDTFTKISQQSSKRSKKSLTKKHSTVNLKRSAELPKLSLRNQQNDLKQKSRISLRLETVKQKSQSALIKKPTFLPVENKILPQDSQIIEQSVKKLSQIRQEKHEDTISRSLKVNDGNSMQNSVSKSGQQTMMHLSINSIYRDTRRQLGCILETTEMRESNLRRSIQSSLSQLQKSRQKINIEKFKQPKKIGEMGSQISEVEQNMTTIQKIQFHIELINTLSNFVYKSTELQYLMEDWDELNFLIYKKFYLQRMKVLNFLKKYPIKNPFCIKRASIQTKQLLSSLRQNELDIKRIKNNLEIENSAIKKNLQAFYNQFSQDKHGQKINLFEYDNFSHWIYKQLWDEIQLFSYSQSHNRAELQDRICKSLQAGFLISELNGNFVTPFEDAEIASHQNKQRVYIEDNLKIFERYVLNKKK